MRGSEIRQAIVVMLATKQSGMTTRELADLLGLPVLKIRPRVSELYRDGEIAPHPFRRRTDQGGRWHETIWLGRGTS